jgi:hypothetical protein
MGSYALLPLMIMMLTACYVFQNKTPGFRATKGRYTLLQWIVSLSFVLILVYTNLYCKITFQKESKQWLDDHMLFLVLCTLSVIVVVGLCLLETILDLFVYPAPPSTPSTSEEAVQSTNHRSKIIWFVMEVLVVLFMIIYIITRYRPQQNSSSINRSDKKNGSTDKKNGSTTTPKKTGKGESFNNPILQLGSTGQGESFYNQILQLMSSTTPNGSTGKGESFYNPILHGSTTLNGSTTSTTANPKAGRDGNHEIKFVPMGR